MSETTSLDVSRKLRDAGIEIETYSVWAERKDNRSSYVKHRLLDRRIYTYLVSAPTIAELRAYIEGKGEWRQFKGWLSNYHVNCRDVIDKVTDADSLAEIYMNWPNRKSKK